LHTALEDIGGEPVNLRRVRALCVADRQFLMRELQKHLGHNGFWCSQRCRHCESLFDVYVDYHALPVVEAKTGYPFVDVELGADPIRLRLPNGADQERLARLSPEDGEEHVLRSLLQWCREPDGNATYESTNIGSENTVPVVEFSDEALQRIDRAMDHISPAVVTEISAACSHCGEHNTLPLDPYGVLAARGDDLLEEIHQLAFHYHWSEEQILSLPRTRRHRYLTLIDRARGMVQ
jgi:hypothetical protein